eukprot:CAMPEP_0114558158 /NCGR_PEP_ID=MMETSP0114-20121206/10222_1 /TAXON_ID=31324 /ORGANISM="Goniomonas sp, Strain m" /LENGTH=271 /DNA_ID=CAMNT_0001743509 /DNA_START=17 /DNA_END=832 /DNA_ORIENTATION=+
MVFDEDVEASSLLRPGASGDEADPKRRRCIAGLAVIFVLFLVLGLISSWFVQSPQNNDFPEWAAHDKIGNKIYRDSVPKNHLGYAHGPQPQHGGANIHEESTHRKISDEASSRQAVIDRINNKFSKTAAAAPPPNHQAHAGSVNPRFLPEHKQNEIRKQHLAHFSWMDIFGVVGALCVAGAFVPQLVLFFRSRDASSFSMLSLLMAASGSLCFGVFYYSTHSYGVALLCLFVAANCTVMAILKLRFDANNKEDQDLPLMGGRDRWYNHDVL